MDVTKINMVANTCNPSAWGGDNGKNPVFQWPLSQVTWCVSSSGRDPVSKTKLDGEG